jgi:hypothetical protein
MKGDNVRDLGSAMSQAVSAPEKSPMTRGSHQIS